MGVRRAQVLGYPTANSEGKDMCRTSGKPERNWKRLRTYKTYVTSSKEATNILYAGQRVGPTKKGARSFLAERVFPTPDQIFLGRTEPDGIEMVVGHVTGPQGPRSTLGYHEYTRGSTISFDVLVAQDAIPHEWWPDLWTLIEENGIGALRSQGYGKSDVLLWEQIDRLSTAPTPDEQLQLSRNGVDEAPQVARATSRR